MKNKKGFVYITDAVLAIVILFIGSIIILTAFYSEPSVLQLNTLASSVLLLMTESRFADYTAVPAIQSLPNQINTNLNTSITAQHTFAEALLIISQVNTTDFPLAINYSQSIIGNVTQREFPQESNLIVRLNESIIYQSRQQTDVLAQIPAKTLVVYVNEQQQVIGPVILEVSVWQ